MRYCFLSLFFLILTSTNAQKGKPLFAIEKWDSIPKGKAGIYGYFMPRKDVKTGGEPQFIQLLNVETNKVFFFVIKGSIKDEKQKPFFFTLNPGKYRILNYIWTKGIGVVGIKYTEPIFKHIDASEDFNKKVKSGEINPDSLERYEFVVEENTLHYLGTWHFETGLVSFSNDKESFDEIVKPKRTKLKFDKAKITLPQ